MEKLKQRFRSLKKGYHFLAYCITFTGLACLISGLGPLIPYLSYYSGNHIQSYSFFFFIRASAFIIGSLSLSIIEKYCNYHQILTLSTIVAFVSLILFSLSLNHIFQGILLFFISLACCYYNIFGNVAIIKSQKKGDIQIWILVAHSFFGIRGLIGPYLVYLFQTYSFFVFGLILIISVPFYINLKSPQLQDEQQIQILTQYSHSIQEAHQFQSQKNDSLRAQQLSNRRLPIQMEHSISILVFLYLSMECAFTNWIPSYSVLENISTKQQATKYGSYFWASMAIFRLLVLFLPYNPIKKLEMLIISLLMFISISFILIFVGQVELACTFSSFSFGISLCSVYSLLFSTPSYLKFQTSSSQAANFVFWGSIGQGIIPTIVGYLMVYMSTNILFYFMLILSTIFWIYIKILIRQYQDYQITIQQKKLKKIQKNNEILKQKQQKKLMKLSLRRKITYT